MRGTQESPQVHLSHHLVFLAHLLFLLEFSLALIELADIPLCYNRDLPILAMGHDELEIPFGEDDTVDHTEHSYLEDEFLFDASPHLDSIVIATSQPDILAPKPHKINTDNTLQMPLIFIHSRFANLNPNLIPRNLQLQNIKLPRFTADGQIFVNGLQNRDVLCIGDPC